MKNETFHVDFILDSIRKIEDCINGITKETFKEVQEKQSTVILHLMLIGESSKKLTEETRNKMDLPWKQIAGFRDIAIHDYITLDLDRIWDSVNKDIPELKEKLLKYKLMV